MEIKDLDNNALFRRYSELRIEIDTKYLEKKQLEEELKNRLRDGRLGGKINGWNRGKFIKKKNR